MKRVPLTRAVALAFALGLGSCGLVLEDYVLDTTLLDEGSCEQGEYRCNADWLTTCDATLKGWVRVTSCETAALCNARAGRCDACRGGEYRCVGGRLETCSADRTSFEQVQDCGSAEQCNVNLAACGACVPGNYQCNQGGLALCTASGSWGMAMPCSPPAGCTVSPDRKVGQCLSAVCTPDAYSCKGAQLERCDKDGTVLQPIELCASPALCEQAKLGSGVATCPPPACAADSHNCNGNTLQKCNADRTAFVDAMVCSAENPCNPAGTCGKCSPGAFHCQGPALLLCNASGVFEKQQDCASPGLCDPKGGTCRPPTCDNPGEGLCDPQSGSLMVCSADFEWVQKDVCDTLALCNAAERRCDEALCAGGAERCEQNELQECNPDLTGWLPTRETCPEGSQCDLLAESGCSGACTEGTFRCNDIFVEACVGGTWTRIARCESSSLCSISPSGDSGVCRPPECPMEGALMCDANNDLKRCQRDLTWSAPILSCGDPKVAKCDAATGTCK